MIVTVPAPAFCSSIQQPETITVPAWGNITGTGLAFVKDTSLPQSLA
jgi:hypothetical protein